MTVTGDRSRADVGAGVLRSAVRWSRLIALSAVLLFGVLGIVSPGGAATLGIVLAAVGLIAGVPHGALDHLLAMRLAGGRSMVMIVALYAGLAALVWGLMHWAGTVTLVAVIALSAVHFGLGELEVSRQLTDWRPGRVTSAAVVVAGCGALVLPLARSGDQWRTVATAVSPDLAAAIGTPAVQIGLVAAWTVAAVAAAVASLRAGRGGVAVDIAVIAALGLVVPPLAAFAVWFGGWHALRHTARVLTVEPGCAAMLAEGERSGAVRRLIRLAALPTVAVLSVVAAMVWFTASAPDPAVAMAQILRILLALTVPHMVVVLWLDRAAHSDPRHLPAGAC